MALRDPARSWRGISRREFLELSVASATTAALGISPRAARADPAGAPGRVVHVQHPDATSWDFATGWYGDHVDQAIVDAMLERGVMELAGVGSPATAWAQIIPGYVPGQKIAIKVNLNNARSCDDADNAIDASIEVVNALVRGLLTIGASPSDVRVFEAVRTLPYRFLDGCLYPGVEFYSGSTDCGGLHASFVSGDPDAAVQFTAPGLPSKRICDVVIDSDYLINVPLMKTHTGAGVTLGFKNHFGTIERPGHLHPWAFLDRAEYSPAYSPLVDIHRNPHILQKTVLVVGDGLFASTSGQAGTPTPWISYGNRSPNSLFLSQDPVAIDCVMYDQLAAETPLAPGSDDYLSIAGDLGLGIFEHATEGAYVFIDYRPVMLTACDDGVDNDGDGAADYPADVGCANPESDVESPQCSDGIDNDGQPGTDFDGGEWVLGAGNGDPNGPDPQCVGKSWRNNEALYRSSYPCGLGAEVALLLAPLFWLWTRRTIQPPEGPGTSAPSVVNQSPANVLRRTAGGG